MGLLISAGEYGRRYNIAMSSINLLTHERLIKIYDILDTDKGTLALLTWLRGGMWCALFFYYWISFADEPIDAGRWRFVGGLGFFAIYALLCIWIELTASEWLLRRPALYAQVLADITFYTFFYALANTPRSDIYLLYLLPLFTAVRFLGIEQGVGICVVVVICFNTVLFSARVTGNDLERLKLIRLLLARNFILGGFTFFMAFRRRFSVPDAVRRQDRQLRSTFDGSSAGICVVDQHQRILAINDVLRKRHGDFQSGQTCAQYFGCAAQSGCRWCTVRSANPGGQHSLEAHAHLFHDSTAQPYSASIAALPMLDDRGTVVGAIALVTDISAQTRQIQELEDELDESTDQVRDLTLARAKWLATYNDLGKRLAGLADQEELLQFVVKETRARLTAEVSSIFLREPHSNWLVRRATAGIDEQWLADEKYLIGESIVGRTLTPVRDQKYGQPLRLINVAQDERINPAMLVRYEAKLASGRLHSLITVPLNGQQGSFGVLRVLNKLDSSGGLAPEGFTQEDEDFLVTIASMIAIAVENTRLLTEVTHYLREIKAVHDASQAASSSSQWREILHTIVTLAGRVSGSDLTGVVLVSKGGALAPSVEDRPPGRPLHLRARKDGITHSIIRHKQPFFCDDVTEQPQNHNPIIVEEGYRSYAGLPIITRNRVRGVLFVHSYAPNAFSRKQDLLTIFCHHVATALENARQLGHLDEAARANAREQISEDIHDTMNFVHGALVLGLANQKELMAEHNYPAALAQLERINKAANHTYQNLRKLMRDVRASVLQEQGLIPALEQYVQLLTLAKVSFVSAGEGHLPEDVEHALYKIAQEALHNASKHRRATGEIHIQVTLTVNPQHFCLELTDDGPGFHAAAMLERSDSFGLQSMKRLAQSIHAQLEIAAQPGQGTTVRVQGSF